MKQAVIFDMDGVLVDNRDIHLEAFDVLFARHGLSAPREKMLMQFGKVNLAIFRDVFGDRFTDGETAAFGKEKEEIYREIFARKIEPARGLVPFLAGLKKRGARIAVGSSGPLANVQFVLEKCGIAEYFDAIADGDRISRGKPDPEVFLLAARLLNDDPSQCIVFEDAIVGIEAGKRAGMTVIAMDTTFPREMLSGSGYDGIVSDFTEVDASILDKY